MDVLPGCLMLDMGSLADGKVMNIIGMFPKTSSLLREKYCSILSTQSHEHTQKTEHDLTLENPHTKTHFLRGPSAHENN